MATVLLIDDDQTVGKYTAECITSGLHSVDWIRKDYWQEAGAAVAGAANTIWDILVLDVHYPTDHWGGLWLYNDLKRKGLRGRWKHTIVFSCYVQPNLDRATEGEALVLRAFLDTANIPIECALPNRDFNRADLLDAIRRLA